MRAQILAPSAFSDRYIYSRTPRNSWAAEMGRDPAAQGGASAYHYSRGKQGASPREEKLLHDSGAFFQRAPSEKRNSPALPSDQYRPSAVAQQQPRLPQEGSVYFQPYFARPAASDSRFSGASKSPPLSPAEGVARGREATAAEREEESGESRGRGGGGRMMTATGLAGLANTGAASRLLGVQQFVSTASHAAHPAVEERGGPAGSERVGSRPDFFKTVLEGSTQFAQRMGTFAMEEGGRLLERSNLTGDGPKPLRALCFLGGLAIVVLTGLQTLNVFVVFTSPTSYFLQLFLLFFGVTVCVVEAKGVEALERAQPFFHTWFKFLTVPLGKGLFYMLIGAIAMSLWPINVLLLAAGAYVAAMGVMWVMVHLGMRHQLQQRGIDVSSGGASPRGSVGLGEGLDGLRHQQPLYQMPER